MKCDQWNLLAVRHVSIFYLPGPTTCWMQDRIEVWEEFGVTLLVGSEEVQFFLFDVFGGVGVSLVGFELYGDLKIF